MNRQTRTPASAPSPDQTPSKPVPVAAGRTSAASPARKPAASRASAKSSDRVLRGTRIVSLALNLPGPAALMRLRELGATCLKIEPPAGDPMARYSTAAYEALHRGVRVLSLDLKTEAGHARLMKQLAKTDVLLTSFRPSALARLKLDAATLRASLPELSTVAIVGAPGARAERPGHDLTYLAEQDLLTGTDLPATLYADMAGSMQAVEAVLGCVLHRATQGRGRHCTVALSEAVQVMALPRTWGLTTPDAVIGGRHAGYHVYACSDGRVALAALEPHFAACLCKAVGLQPDAGEVTLELLKPTSRQHIAGFMAARTRAEIQRLGELYDLPLEVMKAA